MIMRDMIKNSNDGDLWDCLVPYLEELMNRAGDLSEMEGVDRREVKDFLDQMWCTATDMNQYIADHSGPSVEEELREMQADESMRYRMRG